MKLINADCIEAMKAMPDNSVDSIVTDPPYELGFMGKSWDASGIAFNVDVWREALRVIKPGGHLIAFSGSRTYHRMAVAIEDAGFEIRDQIMWVYGSGFPKSHNISKGIDKSDAVEMRRQRDLKFTEWMQSTGLSQSECALHIQSFAKNIQTAKAMAQHYFSDKQQPSIATKEIFDKLRPYLPEVPDWVEQMVAERTIESENFKKREVVGVRDVPIGHAFAGEVYGNDSSNKEVNITAPATPAAKQWDGWGTALKPAHEPMVLARKPFIGTVANNVLTHGTGGLNIDGSRVGSEGGGNSCAGGDSCKCSDKNEIFGATKHPVKPLGEFGRWPANFIHDGSDEVVALFPNSKAPKPYGGEEYKETSMFGIGGVNHGNEYGDSGSAARFFYCAKASKRDRNEGLDGFELKIPEGRDAGQDTRQSPRKVNPIPRANHHPTVKPTTLMQYLVRLVTPPNGTVLDPFMGSGSTGKACAYEGFDFIGIDQSAEYVAIAQARIDFATNDKLPL